MSISDAFTLVNRRYIKEYETDALRYRHNKTGADVLSLVNKDDNKVFGITFKTPPKDSTGIAHILEHSVLCGSRKYPVKEPFKELMKSSLNTFLNAMTYPDKTVYPVASRNLQDFYNLVDVYLDAVFYPKLGRHVFEQEGWHYELESADAELAYKGVVYNEMKGVYSSADSLVYEYAQQSLYPDTTYGRDSGGNPPEILDLSYEEFEAFHRDLYHPANARIFFSGDDDPDQRLEMLDVYLRDFEEAKPDAGIERQIRFSQPHHTEQRYAAGESNDGCFVVLSWMLGEATELKLNLSLSLLSYILTGSPASPLRVALIESGLGEDLTGAGLEAQILQTYFSTGLKGVSEEDAHRVETLILNTLETLVDEGIDPLMIEAAINTVEFGMRENNTGSYPRGLVLMLRSMVTWLYDEDPLDPLEFESVLDEVRVAISEDSSYFERLIKEWFLENPHRTTLVLKPDSELGEHEAAVEQARLAEAQSSMDASDLEQVAQNTADLKALQETPDTPEALASMPSLSLADIEPEVPLIEQEIEVSGKSVELVHEQPTNGIVYIDMGFNLFAVPQKHLQLLPLFGRALTEIGTEKEDYIQLNQRIARKTGGVDVSFYTSRRVEDADSTAWLFVRSKVMASKMDDLQGILEDLLLEIKLDNQERFLQMVLEEKASEEAHIVPGGHSAVRVRLLSRYGLANWIHEQIDGVSYIFFLRELAERVQNDWEGVLAELEAIRTHLLNGAFTVSNLTCDSASRKIVQPRLQELVGRLPAEKDAELFSWESDRLTDAEWLRIPAKVNYVGKSVDLSEFGYTYSGAAMVVNRHIRNDWLWDRVRVLGGAYGCFSGIDLKTRVMSFVSYRDPNVKETFEVYEGTGQFLRTTALSGSDLDNCIIGTMGDLDPCQLPDAKGYSSMLRYLNGFTHERRQQIRDEVLCTKTEDFHVLADILDAARGKGDYAVLGSDDLLEDARSCFPGELTITPVL